MGLPEIKISFKSKALNFIKRSERGVLLLILKDTQAETKVLNSYLDFEAKDFNEKNQKIMDLVFIDKPNKIIVEKVTDFENLALILKKYETKKVDYISIPEATEEEKKLLINFVKEQREKSNTVKAVVFKADKTESEAVINFTTPSITVKNDTFTGGEYCARIGAILSGMPFSRSSTYFDLREVTDFTKLENEDTAVDNGELFLIEKYEKVKLSRGVNSLTTFTSEKSKQFSKIKIVEAMDMILNDIREIFIKDYVGKVINSAINKRLFLDAINGIYFQELKGDVLDPEYDNKLEIDFEENKKYAKLQGEDVEKMTDTEILHYPTGSNVFLTGKIKLVDSMEDLTIKFSI